MRIMLDTNVLISAILFPSMRFNQMFDTIIKEHTLVLSTFIIEEIFNVAKRKFPNHKSDIKRFLERIPFELASTPRITNKAFYIRDDKDYPVLYGAIAANADILITGDKDFASVKIEHLQILTPSQFCEKYLHI